jgi:2-phosphosulfolactate phosphatase
VVIVITSEAVRLHVAFTPREAARVPTGIVVDVLRASSTIVQALEAGYGRVLCCSEIEEARAVRDEIGDAVLAGERSAELINGFDLGNSPRDFLEPRAEALVLTTTNGTRAIVTAAADCDVVLVGSLLNLEAVAAAARTEESDVEIICAGVEGAFALDDAYCAGRIVELLDGGRTDAAEAAVRIAGSFASAEDAFRTSVNPHEREIEEDLLWCARENVSQVVPRFEAMRGPAAEIRPL